MRSGDSFVLGGEEQTQPEVCQRWGGEVPADRFQGRAGTGLVT